MKKKFYCVLDTETATLPFVNQLNLTAKEKKDIAIAKPLIYDIGWTIIDRKGEVFKRRNFLVQETFFVPQVFNTAYYKEKRPIYIDMLTAGKIIPKTWNEIVEILLDDLQMIDAVAAYNAAFDFKKAIPFTEKYIKALYSNSYNSWEEYQKQSCLQNYKGKNEEYLIPEFELRGQKWDIVDLWALACEKLLNNRSYKDFCLKNNFLTNSGEFFATSAEKTFAYIMKDTDFVESHTALDDAEIESQILSKIASKGKIEPTLTAFCFRELGTTWEYVIEKKKYVSVVKERMTEYLDGVENKRAYHSKIERIVERLEMIEA